jgi:PucR C-terminal helix-turn-helix domain
MKRAGTPDRPWDALPRAVADVLRPELPAMADEIIDALRGGVPAYARPLEGDFGRGLRIGVEAALRQFVEEIGGAPTGPGREVYVNLGRGEMRAGRGLDVLLAAYRLGARVAWRRLAAAGRAAGLAPETLYLLAESLFAYIDELSAASAEGYALQQSEAAGELQLRRRRLVRLLVQDPPADPAAIEAAAPEAGWELPRALAALALAGPERERAAARLPGYVLHAPVGELVCGLIGDPDAPGRRAELERALRDEPATGLGPVVAWPEAAVSFARAAAVLRLASGSEGLVRADERTADLLVAGDRRLARDLVDRRLHALDGLAPAARARLADTLAAWLAHQGRLPATATALGVHPQTVRYRLGQLRERLGTALEDPDARFELALALRARALLGDGAADARPERDGVVVG